MRACHRAVVQVEQTLIVILHEVHSRFFLHFTSTIINVGIPEDSWFDRGCQDEALLWLDRDSGESPYWSGLNLSTAARDDCLGAFSL